jgi:hypothetical protein
MSDAKARFRIEGEDATREAFRSALGNAQATADRMKGAFTAAFAGISVTSVAAVAMRAIEMGDSLQKAAVKAGLGARAISELAHAAKMSDVDLQALSTSIRKMQENLSKASSGGKEQAQTLRVLGLTLADIRSLEPDKQFELLADRISLVEDPADRARAATELFGKAGAELLPLFENGAEGIRKAREEAGRLGLALGEDQLKALADTDDAIKRLTASFDGLAASITSAAAPLLTDWSDGLQIMLRAFREVRSEGGSTIDMFRRMQSLRDQALAGRQSQGSDRGTIAGRGGPNPTSSFEAVAASAKSSEGGKALRKVQDEISAADRIRYARMDQALERSRQFSEDVADSFTDIGEMADDFVQRQTESFKKPFEEMTIFSQRAAENMQDAFADFLFDPFQDGLKGMLRGFVDVVRRMVAERAAAQIFGSKSSGGFGLGDLVSTGVKKLFGFANGGSFRVGGSGGTDSQTVAFRATPGEMVDIRTPGQSRGGMTIAPVYNIDARGATTDLVKALPGILRQNNESLKAEMAGLIRGGAFS